MQIAKFYKKHENILLPLFCVICMMFFVGIWFDYYYQANDDVYIKNILSGVYTGTPESHNIQMHFPISLVLSLLYRIAGKLPVYGLFLCGCHYLCAYLILTRSMQLLKNTGTKVVLAATESLLFVGLMLYELVFVQYTVTCTLLAAAAMFRFYTTPDNGGVARFIKANISNILLVLLAFLVRSEMLLLVLPLICVAGMFRWTEQKPVFTKENATKYLIVFGGILLSLACAQLIHTLAYSGVAWRNFTQFFNDRTQLYDYQFIPDYENNQDFYEAIGLLESEQELLENYNFGLDPDINSGVLHDVAAYAAELKSRNTSFGVGFKAAVEDYRYKLTHRVDYPFNVAVIAAYALLLLLAWKNKSYAYIWKIPFLFGIRSGLWLYIIMGGRYPGRITHSLYLMELTLLAALLFAESAKERDALPGNVAEDDRLPEVTRFIRGWQRCAFSVLTILVFGSLAIGFLTDNMQRVQAESAQRDYANREITALDLYCRQNPDKFYLVDVYSAVSCTDYVMSPNAIEYSEKIYKDVNNTIVNYDLMGGWVQNSPLSTKKLAYFGLIGTDDGVSAIEQGILDMDSVYVIIKTGCSMDWLNAYYARKRGIDIEAEIVDTIDLSGTSIYDVYRIRRIS